MALLRAGIRTLCRLAPSAAAAVFDRIWFTPPRTRLRPEAIACLERGEPLHFRVHGRRVAAWSWGTGPTVLLLHGWGGTAGQMHALVEPLLATGARVVAFDAPAHGFSEGSRLGGRRVSFIEIADALRIVAAGAGPLAGLVAHSGGCAVASLAIRDGWTPPPRMAFLAPFALPSSAIEPFADVLGMTAPAVEQFRARVEQRLARAWSDFDIPDLAHGRELPPLLLIHDRGDAEVPYSGSERVAATWPQARLVATDGLGHRRLLREPAVLTQVARFLAPTAAPRPIPTPADSRHELDRDFQSSGIVRPVSCA